MGQINFHELDLIVLIISLCLSVYSLIPFGKISVNENILDRDPLWVFFQFLSSWLAAVTSSDFVYDYFNGISQWGRISIEMISFLIIFVGMMAYFNIIKIEQK